MAYRIVYGPDIPAQYRKRARSHRLQVMIAVCLLIFALLVKQFFPAGADKLQQLLLPGVQTTTQLALSELMNDIQEGITLGDAFTVFCREILENAKIVH